MRTRQKVEKIGISHESDNSRAIQPKDMPVKIDRNKRKNSQSLFDNKAELPQKPVTTERKSRPSLLEGQKKSPRITISTDTATANPPNHRTAVISTHNQPTETDGDRGMSCIIMAVRKLSIATVKVWRITVDKNSGIRVVIHCNDQEVVNILTSSTTCSNDAWNVWSRDIAKIMFHSDQDTASDHYRAGK